MSQFDSLDRAFSQIDVQKQSEVEGGNWGRRLARSKRWAAFVDVANYVGDSFEGSYGAQTWETGIRPRR